MGPEKGLIDEWKAEYGKVFAIGYGEEDYIFRPLTFGEYHEALRLERLLGSTQAEDFVVKSILLHPEYDADEVSAGLFTSITEMAFAVSGFSDMNVLRVAIEEKREEMQRMRGAIFSFIIAAMPSYKVEDLDELNMDKVAELVAIAEKVVAVSQTVAYADGEVTLDITNGEEEQEQPQEMVDPIAQKLAQAVG